MEVEFSALTDIGRVRGGNEDNFLVDRKLQLYVVCDGMGGHQAGAVASATAVNVVRETIAKGRTSLISFDRADGTASERDILALLEQAVQTANARIYERGRNNPDQRGMGTTLSLILLCGDHLFTAHVGDSRIYRHRQDHTEQLTRDHSLLEEIKDKQPGMTPNVFDDRLRNAITRALGGAPTVEVDTAVAPIESGDVFMLCTDGLCGYFDTIDPDPYLSAQDLDASVKGFIDAANDRGGQDNITVLIVRVTSDEEGVARPRRRPLFPALSAVSELAHLDPNHVRHMVRTAEERIYAPQEVVAEPGNNPDGFWIVVEGEAMSEAGGGRTKRPARGALLGTTAFTTSSPLRDRLSVGENEELRTIFISRARYRSWAADIPDLALRISHAIIRSMTRKTMGRLAAPSPQDLDPAHWHEKPPTGGILDTIEELDPGLLTPDALRPKPATRSRPAPPPPPVSLPASQEGSNSDSSDP